MTKMALGPSLSQARDSTTDTNHRHQHTHPHLHSHIRARHHHHHPGDTVDNNHIRSHEKPQQRDAADLESNLITEVVQTVSVVQIVDGSGSAVEIKTYFPDTAVQSDNPAAGLTAAAASIVDSATPTAASPSSSDDVLPTEPAADLSTTSALLSSLSDPGTLTSAPSSSFTSVPSVSGVYNATSKYKLPDCRSDWSETRRAPEANQT